MIDPLVTVIAFLGSDADLNTLTGGQIAAKHRFGMEADADGTLRGWPTPSAALVVSYDGGGVPDLYTGTGNARLEVKAYGRSQAEAIQVYARFAAICDAFLRQPVLLPTGETALMYWLVLDTSPQTDQDPETHVDFIRVFAHTRVHTQPL
jgi:phytoene dehydrogenase-like protein